MKKVIIIYLFTIPLLMFSCSKDTDIATNPSSSKDFIAKVISPYFYWTTFTYWDPLYNKYFTHCTPDYSFTYQGYNFELGYSRINNNNGTYLNTIIVNENGVLRTTVSWSNSDYQYNPRTILSPTFSINNQMLRLSIYVDEFYVPMQVYSEPYSIRVSISDGR